MLMRALMVSLLLVHCVASPAFASGSKSVISPARPSDGSATALVELGQKYEHGEGVARDPDKAHKAYCEAARMGSPAAYFQLGWMYLNGHGVIRDDSVGVFWLSKAAENGIIEANNLLRLLSSTSPARKTSCAQELQHQGRASKEMQALVAAKARAASIDPKLIMALISAESGFDPTAVSPKNARGLMQLTSDTATRFGVEDPFNVEQNLGGGIAFLVHLLKRFHGDVELALAAYNAGEGAIQQWGGIPPYEETIDYVKRVTRICACDSVNGFRLKK